MKYNKNPASKPKYEVAVHINKEMNHSKKVVWEKLVKHVAIN